MKKSAIFLLLISTFLLSACGSKKTASPTPAPSPTTGPVLVELSPAERPYISIIPRADGHELKLKISRIPSSIKQIEYELLYTATDNGMEIEKGIGDNLQVNSPTIERDLLLGTSSCTNGCKYKYDNGVTGGSLSLTFITGNSQLSTFQTPFTLKSGSEIKKTGLGLTTENFSLTAASVANDFYLLLKNYGLPSSDTAAKTVFSIFASGNGTAKNITTEPASTKVGGTNQLAGDYLLP